MRRGLLSPLANSIFLPQMLTLRIQARRSRSTQSMRVEVNLATACCPGLTAPNPRTPGRNGWTPYEAHNSDGRG